MVCMALEMGLMVLKLTLGPPGQKLWYPSALPPTADRGRPSIFSLESSC